MKVHLLSWGIALVFLATSLGSWAGQKEKSNLRVFASITLTDALTDIAHDYEKSSGRTVQFNFAGSDRLAQQIEYGVPIDVFLCADSKWMDVLQDKRMIRSDTRRSLVSSGLVLIVNKASPLTIHNPEDLLLAKIGKIAIAESKGVPSGYIIREYLKDHDIWEKIQSRVVQTDNARGTLGLVASDQVGAGFVYKADVAISHEVKIAYTIPTDDVPEIIFIGAVTRFSSNPDAARDFLDYLSLPAAQDVFRRYGFTVLH